MNIAPFLVRGANQQSISMGTPYHLVPETHALFFGPAECARHTFFDLVDDPRASLLVVDDVRASLGETEDLIREAVDEIVHLHPETRAFVLCTACQTPFLGIDLEMLCSNLHAETGCYFAHIEANRMAVENIPGAKRKQVPGGDRYHFRRALMRTLAQEPKRAGATRGIAVLSDEPLDPENELLAFTNVEGIDWVRSVGDCTSFDEFLELRHALATIALAPAWAEPQAWLEEHLGIPGIYASTSYSLEENDHYYEALEELLRSVNIDVSACEDVMQAVQQARERAQREFESLRDDLSNSYVDLDARMIGRPFSLFEVLLFGEFNIRTFQPSYECVQHKEDDDIPAYERLCKLIPSMEATFATKQKSSERKGPNSTKRAERPGRFIAIKKPAVIDHVPEEVSWWGYASITKLVSEFRKGMQGEQGASGRWRL